MPAREPKRIFRMDWQQDPGMNERALEFVKALSEKSIWRVFEQGKVYAGKVEAEGGFDGLS